MKAPWLLLLQVALLVAWYAIPGMALCPLVIVFFPSIVAAFMLLIFVGALILAAVAGLAASRA